jgi:hypothetical protein
MARAGCRDRAASGNRRHISGQLALGAAGNGLSVGPPAQRIMASSSKLCALVGLFIGFVGLLRVVLVPAAHGLDERQVQRRAGRQNAKPAFNRRLKRRGLQRNISGERQEERERNRIHCAAECIGHCGDVGERAGPKMCFEPSAALTTANPPTRACHAPRAGA